MSVDVMRVRSWFVLLLSGAAITLAGCGSGGPEIVPASGQVTIDGQPLATGVDGFVQVVPTGGRAATGPIDPQTGKFTLTTAEKDDGCITGTHKVVVIMQQMVGQESVSLIPEKYTDLATTDLTLTVDGPSENLLIELSGPLKDASPGAAPISDDPNKF